MRRASLVCASALAVGCGLESFVDNAGHDQYERPASKIAGKLPDGVTLSQVTVADPSGATLTPFQSTANGAAYELRLPSSKYSMLEIKADVANMELRAIVPAIGTESGVTGVDLDARNMAETLIAEARLSADGDTLAKVTPDAYLGTRALIRDAFDQPGPTQDFLTMVTNIMGKFDPTLSVSSPSFFLTPVYDNKFAVKTSALDPNFIARNPFDYVGDGVVRRNSSAFDAKLAEVAQLYRPAGCPDPDKIRVVFTVDFNSATKNGNCGATDRFRWATDKTGKSMFFVGWIYDGSAGLPASDIQDPDVAKLLGSSTPNTIHMYDDGTNGDQTAGDNIWTVTFALPRAAPGHVLRIGYKYTWGTAGAPWTGSEEWPGNSRILEVVDDNGDNFVYRHDVFADEATNKDKSNLNLNGMGSIDWTTDLHNCGTPESHENKYDDNTCRCSDLVTPKWLGPLTVTCSQ